MTSAEERTVDPRDEPAPFAETVILTAGAAVLVVAMLHFFGAPEGVGYGRLVLLGPFGLVLFEVLSHEVWWKRWWGVLPGALVGLIVYSEGRPMAADLIGDEWAQPVAYVLAWTAVAAVFAYASRWPRTHFSVVSAGEERPDGDEAGGASEQPGPARG